MRELRVPRQLFRFFVLCRQRTLQEVHVQRAGIQDSGLNLRVGIRDEH